MPQSGPLLPIAKTGTMPAARHELTTALKNVSPEAPAQLLLTMRGALGQSLFAPAASVGHVMN